MAGQPPDLDWPQSDAIHLHWLFGGATADRAGLRQVLSAYLGVEPERVRLEQAHAGDKPKLLDGHGLCCNWSHSREVAVVAVAHGIELGVDLEFADRKLRALPLAQRYFAPAESAWLGQLPADVQTSAFLRLWTGKEAVLKATGMGLAGGLDRIGLHLDADSGLQLRQSNLPGDLRLRELAVPRQNLLAALAWFGGPCRLRHFDGTEPMPREHLHSPLKWPWPN